MKTIYMFRQQHAGVVTSHAFTSKPTDEQLSPLIAEMERVHGRDGWGMVVECALLDEGEIPAFEQPRAGRETMSISHADIGELSVVATGTVTDAPKSE